MAVIPLAEAIEKIAQVVEIAEGDRLADYYYQLHPAEPTPDIRGTKAKKLAKQLALQIRTGIEPDEAVDLWNRIFRSRTNYYYNEEEDALLPNEREVQYLD